MKLNSVVFIFAAITHTHAAWNKASYSPSELYKKYPDYGLSWMFFPDDNGMPQVALLNITGSYRLDMSDTIFFRLYTRDGNDTEIIYGNKTSVQQSLFNPTLKTIFVVHGWISSSHSSTLQFTKTNFLKMHHCNVILVDWSEIASDMSYITPMRRTLLVGNHVADMIMFLTEFGLNLDNTHIIGHSLGAHVAGFAGKALKGRVSRITGLDPALPGFMTDIDGRLDETDAQFVDVIHTCGGVLGYYFPMGHVDFYPNGGTPAQPGCYGLSQVIEGCSHARSWKLFAYSILYLQAYPSKKCTNWQIFLTASCHNYSSNFLGYHTNTSARGIFYLETEENPPYFTKQL